MGDVAASGGYYIACNANKIVAEPTTITGSIGVFMGKPVVRGLYDWLGVSNEYVMRGKQSGIFRETEKWTPEERAKMEAQTNTIYFDNFLPKVATGRNKSVEEANSLGQGRVCTQGAHSLGVRRHRWGRLDRLGAESHPGEQSGHAHQRHQGQAAPAGPGRLRPMTRGKVLLGVLGRQQHQRPPRGSRGGRESVESLGWVHWHRGWGWGLSA